MGKRGHSIVRTAGFGSGLFAALWFVGSAAWAAPAIYTCIDANGKRLTSDRPIAECLAREQRLLNPDGSLRRIVPPTPTPEERAEQEARERQAAALRVQQQDAIRRDRNLILRFPNEVVHNKARAAALDDIHAAVQLSEKRIAVLTAERKPLLDEMEFYPDGKLPLKLRQQLDANDAASNAQRSLIQNQQAEIVRINMRYDAELERLRKLWGGAPAGSMGTLSAAPAASAARR